MTFDTPQDAEDAFYDALESGDADAMTRVWEASTDIACLLPMSPLIQGPEVLDLWRSMFEQGAAFDIRVRHLGWIETGDMALHLIEERMGAANGRDPNADQAVYGSNLFRLGSDGWRLVAHQNSPAPPPPGALGSAPDARGQT